MGAGSSKEDKTKNTARDAKARSTPVANVNNQSTSPQQKQQPAQKTFITQPDDTLEDKQNTSNLRRKENARDATDYERHQGSRHVTDPFQSEWRPLQESQNELNEVLQIPSDNRYRGGSVNTNPVRHEDLPETYAQRKQREQYTLNQQLLLRQKTIYRNPDEWNENDEENDTKSGGFNPDKFRSANFGKSPKSNVFTTNRNQESSIQYMHGQNMDDFDVAPHQNKTTSELPTYNASEMDLMESLERELL